MWDVLPTDFEQFCCSFVDKKAQNSNKNKDSLRLADAQIK